MDLLAIGLSNMPIKQENLQKNTFYIITKGKLPDEYYDHQSHNSGYYEGDIVLWTGDSGRSSFTIFSRGNSYIYDLDLNNLKPIPIDQYGNKEFGYLISKLKLTHNQALEIYNKFNKDKISILDLQTNRYDKNKHMSYWELLARFVRSLGSKDIPLNELREIYEQCSGEKVKKQILLTDKKGFTKEVLQYTSKVIAFSSSQDFVSSLPQADNTSYFRKTDDKDNLSRIIYKEY